MIIDHLVCSFKEQRKNLERQVFGTIAAVGNGGIETATFRLEQIKYCGGRQPKASTIIQMPTGETRQEIALGNGPIDATYKAVRKAIRHCMTLPEHRLVHCATQATTEDSVVSVMILLQSGDALFPGRGFHTDTIVAFTYAYVDAIGYLLRCCSGNDIE